MRASLAPELCRSIIELYRDGASQTTIASLLRTAQSNVSRVLSKARRQTPGISRRRADADDSRLRIFAASQLGSRCKPVNLDYL
jgi:predicted transcriptional regulator